MQDVTLPRVIEGNYDLEAIITMVLSVPQHLATFVNALAAFPGQGEPWRVRKVVHSWESNSTMSQRLLIAGITPAENERNPVTMSDLCHDYGLTKTKGVETQEIALHTKDQADWIVDRVATYTIPSLALFVSPYHLPRAYCTLVRSFTRLRQPWVPIIPKPVAIAPNVTVPDTKASGWDMVGAEVQRFKHYQAKGDVASLDEMKQYLEWLWHQPLLAM